MRNYAIVAAAVTQPRNQIEYGVGAKPTIKDLAGNTVANLDPDPELQQVLPVGFLTAESVGKLLVEMSQKPEMEGDFRHRNRETVAKACMDFFEISGAFSDSEKTAILDATQVSIQFETRDKTQTPDVNQRVIVVPADSTLKDKQADVTTGTPGVTAPPLTYPLDEALMLSFLRSKLKGYVSSFLATPDGAAIDETTGNKLLDFIDARIDDDAFVDNVNDIKDQILNDPVRAFHRSVGIYATNMCR